jgi:hypothetical protein
VALSVTIPLEEQDAAGTTVAVNLMFLDAHLSAAGAGTGSFSSLQAENKTSEAKIGNNRFFVNIIFKIVRQNNSK